MSKALLQRLAEQEIHGPLHDDGKVSIRDLMTQQMLELLELIVQLMSDSESQPPLQLMSDSESQPPLQPMSDSESKREARRAHKSAARG